MQMEVPLTTIEVAHFTRAIKLAVADFRSILAGSDAGGSNPDVALSLVRIASLYQTMGRTKNATPLFSKALSIFENVFGVGKSSFNTQLHFLNGKCFVSDSQHPVTGNAKLIAIDVTEEARNTVVAKRHPNQRYFQALISWKAPFSPQMPEIYFENALSMVFPEDCLQKFATHLQLKMHRDEQHISIFELVELIREWRHRFGCFELPKNYEWAMPTTIDFSKEFKFISTIEDTNSQLKPAENTSEIKENQTLKTIESVQVSVTLAQQNQEEKKKQSIKTGKQEMPEYTTVSSVRSEKRFLSSRSMFEDNSLKSAPKNDSENKEPVTAVDQLAELVSTKLNNGKLLDLNDLITIKHRKQFVKKLFRKDESKFDYLIDFLNDIPDWKVASEKLEEYFHVNNIYRYDKYAIELSDLVYHRYFPAENETQKLNKFWR